MRLTQTLAIVAFAAGLAANPAGAQTTPTPPAAASAPAVAPAARTWSRYAGVTEVQLRDVAAYVRVRPEDRTDVLVSISNTGPLPAPQFRTSRNRLTIDGRLRRQIRDCDVEGRAGFSVEVARRGRVENSRLPVIELRVPRDVDLSVGGATRLNVGPSRTLELRIDGCGDADIERVDGEADITIAGAPDVRVYDAGETTIAMAGQGDVVLGVARTGLTLSIAGQGDFTAARVDGPTNIAVQGPGDVTIRDGRATLLSIALAGPGDVTHGGSADRLDAVVLGNGEVRVRRVDGQVSRRVLGGGEVIVGR